MPYSSGVRPATAFSPMLGTSMPWKRQTSVPSSLRTTWGASSLVLRREVTLEEVGGLDDVVVDADDDHVVELHGLTSGAGWRRGYRRARRPGPGPRPPPNAKSPLRRVSSATMTGLGEGPWIGGFSVAEGDRSDRTTPSGGPSGSRSVAGGGGGAGVAPPNLPRRGPLLHRRRNRRGRAGAQALLARITRHVTVSAPEPASLDAALADVGTFLGANLVSLMELTVDETTFWRRAEWRRPDMDLWPPFPDEIPLDILPWIGTHLDEIETPFVIPKMAYFPDAAAAARRAMGVLGFKSAGLIPLRRGVRCVGIVFVFWREESGPTETARIEPLGPLGDVLLGALARIDAEIALRARESRYRAILRESPDVIIISSPTGPIEVVSGALERITGSRVADLGGARSSVHPDDLDGVRVSYGKAMSRPREPVPISARVRSTSGEWRRLEGTFTNLLDDPSVGGVVMNAHDVTDRVDLEDKLRHSEKIDELGRLAGAVAHDFRNVSFAIRSFAQFALARVERGDDVSAELREILRGCEHADGLVSQLLSFGRPEPASAAAVDPGAALEELQPTLRRLVPPWVAPRSLVRAEPAARAREPDAARADRAEPRHERGRRHDRRRGAHARVRGRALGRPDRRHRHRHRDGRRDPEADLPAVLHDEGRRRRQRPRALDRVRHRVGGRRPRRGREHTGGGRRASS